MLLTSQEKTNLELDIFKKEYTEIKDELRQRKRSTDNIDKGLLYLIMFVRMCRWECTKTLGQVIGEQEMGGRGAQ